MNYLITGGAGFIGSNIVEHLVNHGHRVRILDNFSTGKYENIQGFRDKIELIEGDIRDLATCRTACQGIDVVFHEAALGSVPRSIEDPMTTNEVNIKGTLNMLLAARDAKIRRFVYASSSSVYGDTPTLPKVETMPPRCLSPYALSKYAGEVYAHQFYELYGLETISLRYFNVFGPRQDPHSQYAAVIPKFISALLKGEAPIIFGDGKQSRDFTYVRDVVSANQLAASASTASCGQAYNIACHQTTTLNQLLAMIQEQIPQSVSVKPLYQQPRPGDILASLADIFLAKNKLGYTPQTSLSQGLMETIAQLKGK